MVGITFFMSRVNLKLAHLVGRSVIHLRSGVHHGALKRLVPRMSEDGNVQLGGFPCSRKSKVSMESPK